MSVKYFSKNNPLFAALFLLVLMLLPSLSVAQKPSPLVGRGSIVSKRVWRTAYSRSHVHQIRIKAIQARQAR